MSPGEQILNELIGGFGDVVSLFFTTMFNVFVIPIWVLLAQWLGLTPTTY